MGWTVDYKRGTDRENVSEWASSEAAARANYAKLTSEGHPDKALSVALTHDGVTVETWNRSDS